MIVSTGSTIKVNLQVHDIQKIMELHLSQTRLCIMEYCLDTPRPSPPSPQPSHSPPSGT